MSNAAGQNWQNDKAVIRYLNQARKVDPQNARWYWELAYFQYQCSTDPEAVERERAQSAVGLMLEGMKRPNAADYPFEVWVAWAKWTAGDHTGAVVDIARAYEDVPQDNKIRADTIFSFFSLAGLFMLEGGKDEGALQSLGFLKPGAVSEEIRGISPHFALADALLKKGKSSQVLKYLWEVVASLPAGTKRSQVEGWITEIQAGEEPQMALY
jgi:hypothetical protein